MQESQINYLTNSAAEADYVSFTLLLKQFNAKENISASPRVINGVLPGYYQQDITSCYMSSANQWIIETSLPSLTGSQGVLPRALYTEALNYQINDSDPAPVDFFDIFNRRYFNYLYETEVKNDVCLTLADEALNFQQQKQHLKSLLINLCGIHPSHNSDKIRADDFIQYTSILGLNIGSPEHLIEVLSDYFEMAFEYEYIGLEYSKLIPNSLTSIGLTGRNRQLSYNALLGSSAPLFNQSLAVKICPKSAEEYQFISNNQKLTSTLEYLATSLLGANVKCKFFMKVDSKYLSSIHISSKPSFDSRIGQSAWMSYEAKDKRYVEVRLIAS